jgi:hypothetical protein
MSYYLSYRHMQITVHEDTPQVRGIARKLEALPSFEAVIRFCGSPFQTGRTQWILVHQKGRYAEVIFLTRHNRQTRGHISLEITP